jgi:hypothetical protein
MRKAEEKLNTPKDIQKEAVLSELRKESLSVICLAAMYATNFEGTGEDITRRLLNADKNADLLQRVYNKGYEEGIYKGRELEREYQKSKGNRNSNTNSNSINSKGRNH